MTQVLLAAVLVLLAGVFSAADAALAPFSRARADELAAEGRAGARQLRHLLLNTPRYVNTMLFLQTLFETAAVVLITLLVAEHWPGRWWLVVLTAVGVMVLVSFVIVGVAPRTLGKIHSERVALLMAGPAVLLTRVLGPLPRLLIALGNAITPGRGIRGGPFSTETELRELVDIAEATSVIEAEERRMIHSVFDLGDTLTREVMVPRNDVVYIERYKNLRQTMSLFLRSGYSRVPVIEENLDEVVGFAYLKDVAQRDFDKPDVETTQRIEELMRPAYFVPDSLPVDDLLRDMQARRQHVAVVVDEYGGTSGLVTIEDILEEIVGEIADEYDEGEEEVEILEEGVVRVPSRFPLGDLDELLGVDLEDEDVDSVGGLITKLLGKVPIAGASVEAEGLRFTAEGVTGRRNRIGSVVVRRLEPDPAADEDED